MIPYIIVKVEELGYKILSTRTHAYLGMDGEWNREERDDDLAVFETRYGAEQYIIGRAPLTQ